MNESSNQEITKLIISNIASLIIGFILGSIFIGSKIRRDLKSLGINKENNFKDLDKIFNSLGANKTLKDLKEENIRKIFDDIAKDKDN